MLPKVKRRRPIRTEASAVQWLRRMGYAIHRQDWPSGAVTVENPQTGVRRIFETAVTAHLFLVEQARAYHQNRLNQNVIQGGHA